MGDMTGTKPVLDHAAELVMVRARPRKETQEEETLKVRRLWSSTAQMGGNAEPASIQTIKMTQSTRFRANL